jgi:protein-S-isoprenylcysteine O-methyltransferase Ste14
VTFRERTINIIYKTATSSKRVRTPLTPIGAIFFFLLTTSFVVLSLQLDRMLKFPKLFSEPFKSTLSVPVLLVGLLIYLWTLLHFFKAKGTPVPFNPPPKVVTTGPYAHCRNPMLTSVFILLFGLAIQFSSISLFFIFTPLYILLNVLELKSIEEPELAKRLGKEYLEYKKSTPMFIPSLRAKSEEK